MRVFDLKICLIPWLEHVEGRIMRGNNNQEEGEKGRSTPHISSTVLQYIQGNVWLIVLFT